MAKSKVFIPEKCRAGFQHREDTFTNKLAYVIYYDAFNKIRKEQSWKNWCHLPKEHGGGNNTYWRDRKQHTIEGIDPFDFDNEPTDGFMLNKGIQRYNWSNYGSGRSMCRIYDPRGIEFEITLENLIGILMHTDCSKREIQGKLVYAWCNRELMLLPCASVEYEAAKNYTKLQAKKVGARELQEGLTYVTKKEEHLIYLGRHMYYEIIDKSSRREDPKRVGKKQYIFCDLDGKFTAIKNIPLTIAAISDNHCHENYSNLVDCYLASEISSRIIKWIEKPIDQKEFDNWEPKKIINAHTNIHGKRYSVSISENFRRAMSFRNTINKREDDGETKLWFRCDKIINADGATKWVRSYDDEHPVSDKSNFFHLYAELENGLSKKWV